MESLRSTFTYGTVVVDNARPAARRRIPHDEPLVAEPHLVADPPG